MQLMNQQEINDWLGKYFLLTISLVGGYLLIFNNTPLLPIEPKDVAPTLEIIAPLFVGQLTLIVKSFTGAQHSNQILVKVPKWLVTWPPMIVIVLMAFAVMQVVYVNRNGIAGVDAPGNLREILTFCVTLLNATTIYVVAASVGANHDMNTLPTNDDRVNGH